MINILENFHDSLNYFRVKPDTNFVRPISPLQHEHGANKNPDVKHHMLLNIFIKCHDSLSHTLLDTPDTKGWKMEARTHTLTDGQEQIYMPPRYGIKMNTGKYRKSSKNYIT